MYKVAPCRILVIVDKNQISLNVLEHWGFGGITKTIIMKITAEIVVGEMTQRHVEMINRLIRTLGGSVEDALNHAMITIANDGEFYFVNNGSEEEEMMDVVFSDRDKFVELMDKKFKNKVNW